MQNCHAPYLGEDPSAPYWNQRMHHSVEEDQDYLLIPQSTQGTGVPHKIPYFVMENWLDYGAGDPNELLDLKICKI